MLLTDFRIVASLPAGLENLTEMLVGFVFVIVVLGILAGVTGATGSVFKYLARRKANAAAAALAERAQAAEQTAAVSPADSVPEEIPPEILVVIAAAVHMVLKQPHRIVSIRPADSHQWAAEGRREISQSHRIR